MSYVSSSFPEVRYFPGRMLVIGKALRLPCPCGSGGPARPWYDRLGHVFRPDLPAAWSRTKALVDRSTRKPPYARPHAIILLTLMPLLTGAQDAVRPCHDLFTRTDSLLEQYPEKALDLARLTRTCAGSNDRPDLVAEAHDRLARAYLELWQFDLAQAHADSALRMATDAEGSPQRIRAHRLLGEVGLRTGDLDVAVDRIEEALTLAIRTGDVDEEMAARMRLAYAHYVGHQTSVTYTHLDTCETHYRTTGDAAGLAAVYNRRAIAMAEDDGLDSIELARMVMDTALYWGRLSGDSSELCRIHINMALISMNMTDLAPASAHTDTAEHLARALRDSFLLVHAHENKAQLLTHLNRPEAALPECRVLLDYGIRHGLLRLQRDGWLCVMNCMRELGDWKAAYEAAWKYWGLNEQMTNKTVREHMLRRSLITESARREQAMQEAHAARLVNDRLWALLIGVVLVAAAAYLVLRQRGRVEREKARALRLRIDQHLVGNAMASLSNYVLKEERLQAYDVLVRYDRFIRDMLDHSAAEAITLRQEMDALANYLAIEQALCGGRFTFALHVERALDPDAVHLAPMLVQPWVENAVKHGVKALPEGGRIEVRFTLDGRTLQVVVEDNGPGMRATSGQQTGASWGTRITGARLKALSRRCSQPGSYHYETVERGTRLVLRLPTIRMD
ncbi:MAG: hypothetical protein GFGODING_02742 [Flavobacteriales bacterium]|nr:hypothetical protein [Flavobacteriales bacterium]